jgi:carboxylesterase type B
LHAGDQTFLFGSLDTQAGHHLCGHAQDKADEEARTRMMHVMQDTVLAYARHGDPNKHNNQDAPQWPQYKADERAIMSFDLQSKIVKDPAAPRREWWYSRIYEPALKGRL